MSEAPDTTRDWRDTVFLPRTDFPMKAGLPQKEPGILARWQEMGLYQQLRAARAGRDKFILHDGPPYANGDMHIGHALNHILKDMVCRTRNLMGFDAPYVPGWDCHGLPIEWKVEEEYRKKKRNKDEIPPEEFRAECRAYARHWVDTQREQLKRLGILGDWDHPYLTMDFEAEATIVAELLKFAQSGQLYRGAKPVMWSPVEKTALAEAEIEYEEIRSTQIDVAFEIGFAPDAFELMGAYAVIWTTTPWTIPVNQALAYGPEIEYQAVRLETVHRLDAAHPHDLSAIEKWRTRQFLIAKDEALQAQFLKRVGAALSAENAPHEISVHIAEVCWEGPGSALAGATAVHPMHRLGGFFAKRRPFLPGDFVTTDAGTGLVHMAPDHGEDDFALCKAHGIDPVFAVEADGRYRADWEWLGGEGSVINKKFVAADGPICAGLRAAGALLAASDDFPHSYPHSWRSKQKVIFRCTPQWFVPMDRDLAGDAMVGLPLADVPLASDLAGVRAILPGGMGEVVGFNRSLDYLVLMVNGEKHLVCEPTVPAYLKATGAPFDLVELVKGALFVGASVEADGVRLPLQHDDGVSFRDGTGFAWLGTPDTLRGRALKAIADTRFYPEKRRNRIGAMVEGRPDWVLSRQRAWGVPITLFVHRKTGAYLVDDAVNARIVAAVRAGGVDAWSDARAQELLGDGHAAEDYERVTDILDVWFDSGSTHAFVLESGRWGDLQWPADLYLEGADQHRGWFQSSLLESCATRGRAPFNAILTHGFTMDAKGLKMSKSLGNTVNPLDLMRDYGADILRLWALSVDFTEDHRIGKEILAGVADQYRKLRNSFRYMLGALDGFAEEERVAPGDMPALERYMLSQLAALDAELKSAATSYDFNRYVRALSDFANEDLSAFYFDIRKDTLYCDVGPAVPGGTTKRRAYRTVLDTLFHALVRYAAPVLVFTAEEVWSMRYPEGQSVHLLEWPMLPEIGAQEGEPERWEKLRALRVEVLGAIEPLRREKTLGSSLEAEIKLPASMAEGADAEALAELFISGVVRVDEAFMMLDVARTEHAKCDRCWRHLPDVGVDTALCGRCAEVVE